MLLSVVIPAFNESNNIANVITELQQTIKGCTSIENYEIIVVDDHSSDQTFDVIHNLNLKRVKCLRLSRRSGSHTALRAGLHHTKGHIVMCLSADGQDNPCVLDQMIGKIKEGSHTVWAIRTNRDEPYLNKLLSIGFYRILKCFLKQENNINLANADFYLLSRKVVNAINNCTERNTSLFGLIIWLGFKQDFVEYTRRNRISGKSKWNFKSRFRLAKDWIIAFSGLPLKLATYLGISIATLGFLYSFFIIIYSILGYVKPGWAETVILMLIGGGVAMIMLGILGEYLWRTLDESRNRPLYFIEEETMQEDVIVIEPFEKKMS